MQATVVIYGMQIDNKMLYPGIANQPSAAYFFPVFVQFSFHSLDNEIFRQRILWNKQARVVIFGMQIDDDVFYRGTENQPFAAYSSMFVYLSNFLSFHN